MKLDEALIRQKRLGHLCERHPDRQGRHILAAGEMEMPHMVGTLEVFDVREGQHPQTRRSVQLFRRDRQQ